MLSDLIKMSGDHWILKIVKLEKKQTQYYLLNSINSLDGGWLTEDRG